MPTIISHPAAAIGFFPWFRRRLKHPAILLTGMILTAVPDIDVIGFRFGIAYGDLFGHRGFTHSLFFALTFGGLVAWLVARLFRTGFREVWLYFFLCLASHGMLDALTNGGLGVAFFSPFSNERYFFEFRPIQVSAISVGRFFAGDWTGLLAIELMWVWLPAMLLAIAGVLWRRLSAARPAGVTAAVQQELDR